MADKKESAYEESREYWRQTAKECRQILRANGLAHLYPNSLEAKEAQETGRIPEYTEAYLESFQESPLSKTAKMATAIGGDVPAVIVGREPKSDAFENKEEDSATEDTWKQRCMNLKTILRALQFDDLVPDTLLQSIPDNEQVVEENMQLKLLLVQAHKALGLAGKPIPCLPVEDGYDPTVE